MPWAVTSRNMIIEQVGGPTPFTAPSEHVIPPGETNSAMTRMTNHFKNANMGPQRKLDECAKQCAR